MVQSKSMNEPARLEVLVLLVLLLSIGISGCRRTRNGSKAKDSDSVAYFLKESVRRLGNPIEAQQRTQMAISKWANGVIDAEPILIGAFLGRPRASEQKVLALLTFDEEEDVIGFVVKEEYIDPNSVKLTLYEEYPAYTHMSRRDVTELKWFPVEVRDANQEKDDQLWSRYVDTPLDQLVEEYIARNRIDPNKVWLLEPSRDTRPTMWVSIPEPNTVDVWIYVYDKAGHKSEPVKLFNLMNKSSDD